MARHLSFRTNDNSFVGTGGFWLLPIERGLADLCFDNFFGEKSVAREARRDRGKRPTLPDDCKLIRTRNLNFLSPERL